MRMPLRPSRASLTLALLVAVATGAASATTAITAPPNMFSPAEDVELGREAAEVLRGQVPVIADGHVDRFLDEMGGRLVEVLPDSLHQPAFTYTFSILNVSDAASFGFPGGPIFISRRMIELAKNEDGLAALVAHELAHVALRHGTAQVSRHQEYQIGAITGRQIGLAAAAPLPGILGRGAEFSVRAYFLRYSPDDERQADLLAADLTGRAGYDPGALITMRKAISSKALAHGGLAWTIDHPAKWGGHDAPLAADIGQPVSAAFEAIQARLHAMPRPDAALATRADLAIPVGTVGYNVAVPHGDSRSLTAGDLLQLSVPLNWRRLLVANTVTFAPEGAFIELRDRPAALTHGVQVGVARSLSGGDLERDLRWLLQALGDNNPRLTWTPAYQDVRVAGRTALTTTLSHVSPVTGEFEWVGITALHLADESLLYIIGVAPQAEAGTYRNAFDRLVASLQVLP